jgi:hypothetical protein
LRKRNAHGSYIGGWGSLLDEQLWPE